MSLLAAICRRVLGRDVRCRHADIVVSIVSLPLARTDSVTGFACNSREEVACTRYLRGLYCQPSVLREFQSGFFHECCFKKPSVPQTSSVISHPGRVSITLYKAAVIECACDSWVRGRVTLQLGLSSFSLHRFEMFDCCAFGDSGSAEP